MAVNLPESHIVALLDHAAVTEAGIIIYSHGEKLKPFYLSYSNLRTLAMQKAELLRCSEDIFPGKIVLLHFQSNLERIIWLWASILAGCVPCLSTQLVNNHEGRISHFKHLHRLFQDPLMITNQQCMNGDLVENTILRVVCVEEIETWKPSKLEKSPDHCAAARSNTEKLAGSVIPHGNLAVLMLTSGSTGNAKAVCLTHRQIIAAIKGKLAVMPLPRGSALLNWIALDHVASLVEIHLCAMFSGLDQVHVPAAEVISDPILFLALLSDHGVSRTFAPDFFLRKLQTALDAIPTEQLKHISLHRLLYIASGGEANNVHTCARMTAYLIKFGATKQNIITPGFGMTETCAGAIFNRNCPAVDLKAGKEFTCLGNCMPGIEMRISSTAHLDSKSHPIEGGLEIRGEVVFERYFNDEKATRDAFTPDGWYKTGDLGSIDASGSLRLTGRSKEVININGIKYLPHEIEEAINQAIIPGIAPSYVVCLADRASGSSTEGIIVVYQHTYQPDDVQARMATLRSIIRIVVLFAGVRPRVLPLPRGRLDKTTLGKLSRTKIHFAIVQGQYLDEEELDRLTVESYRTSHSADKGDDTERTLMSVFSDILQIEDDLTIDTPILDTGITSVDLIRLKGACEKAFGISGISMITIMTHITIRSLTYAIKRIQQDSQYKDVYNPVVTLQPNGVKTPLWLIHPGIGEVLVFLGLAQYFPDRPIHALRARGFNHGEIPFTDLQDVLTTYYASLKKQQPQGPYAIAGYSYGSMIAFELAKMLEANGDTVQFLGSFNLPPYIKERMRTLDWTAGILHISHFCGIITEQQSEEVCDDLRGLQPIEQVVRVLAKSDAKRRAELGLTRDSLYTWTQVAWSLQKIGWEYEPSSAVAHMDVFYCQPLKAVARTREEYRNTKLNHWVNFVREGVRYHEVDGEHYTMIGAEHVLKFQHTLKKALSARGL